MLELASLYSNLGREQYFRRSIDFGKFQVGRRGRMNSGRYLSTHKRKWVNTRLKRDFRAQRLLSQRMVNPCRLVEYVALAVKADLHLAHCNTTTREKRESVNRHKSNKVKSEVPMEPTSSVRSNNSPPPKTGNDEDAEDDAKDVKSKKKKAAR